MKTEIINIGDEILIGQITNTNAVWIAQEFNALGLSIHKMTTIGDTKEAITNALTSSFEENDVIILTGGLGPTKDDVTKKTIADFFHVELEENEEVYLLLKNWFESRGRELKDVNRLQASVPKNCKVLMNYWGTAPGMLFEENGKILVSLPGVPIEMKNLMSKHFFPYIQEKFNLKPLIHKSFLTEGIPESDLMKTIENWEDNLPDSLKLAYLPSAGMVKLRLSSQNLDGNAENIIEEESKKLHQIIGDEIYAYNDSSLEETIINLLQSRNESIAIAESCTGGYVSHKITSVPGASKVFWGSMITYDYTIKENELDVKKETLEKYGAVSKECVLEMAENIRTKMGTTYALSFSGIAGPDGGTEEKPVGTIWMAWATPKETIAKKFQFPNDRLGNIHRSSMTSLNILRKLILGIEIKKTIWEKE